MLGKKVNLAAPPAAGGLYALFAVDTTQSMLAWSVNGYVYDKTAPLTSLMSLTCTIDDDEKTILVKLSAADCEELMDTTTYEDQIYGYVVRVDPGIGDYLRFFYGDLTIIAGGPDDVASSPSSSPSAS